MRTAVDTEWIAERARALGFDLCGVAPAAKFPELARADDWFARGLAGEMKYLGDARRGDPALVLQGARSVIVCGMNYNSGLPRSVEFGSESGEGLREDEHGARGWISRYAWGDDYHDVLRSRLNVLVAEMRERFEESSDESFEALAYADTGPIQERVFANHAGIGWIGKNTLVLNQQMGSWFFLGVVLTTLELAPSLGAVDAPPADLCGSCTRCIDACPTDALIAPYEMDARRCISYLTIEHRGAIPEEFREAIGNHVYGCDICQDVCPWNRRAPIAVTEGMTPRGELINPELEWLANMDSSEFKLWFAGSPLERTRRKRLLRNVAIAMGNSGDTKFLPKLEEWAVSDDAVLAESAQWAVEQIKGVGKTAAHISPSASI
jgi:epoxyqueuosine reductase